MGYSVTLYIYKKKGSTYKMKLLNFRKSGNVHLGIKTDKGILDVRSAAESLNEEHIPTNIMDVICDGEETKKVLQTFVEDPRVAAFFSEEEGIEWAPAVTEPKKIICVGLNYKKHADETKSPYPKIPILFNKFENALSGHLNKVVVPRQTERLDHEVELGIVIGKTAKDVTEEEALDYVFGYCTTNDLSARDVQKHGVQWMTGKTFDGFAPVGPYLVTKDEIENPNNLRVTAKVNGKVHQDSNTSDMIFNCEELISYISAHMTLQPGDIILTGTPEGVILGWPKEKRVYMTAGDEVTVEVEKLGALTTKFIAPESE